MKEIQTRELERCIKFIKAIGCKYAIVTDDGARYVDGLEIAEPKSRKPRSASVYPHGTLTAYFRPLVNLNAPNGDVQEVPVGRFPPEVLRRSICSFLSTEWGNGSYVTNIKEDCIEIMRIPPKNLRKAVAAATI